MSEKTVHSYQTPHGYRTPHKYPFGGGSGEADNDIQELRILKDLSIQLYPTGRAWYRPENGSFQAMHDAINVSFLRLVKDARQTIDSTFPDNPNFSVEDAELWEYRLGLITNENVGLELRKAAIKRKLGHPNNIKARQHPLFIQKQLQLAGFNVWVHENLPPYQTPNDLGNFNQNELQHGGDTQHSDNTLHGGDSFTVIANSNQPGEQYGVGEGNLWATFFIGGENLGDTTNVPESRQIEFRELVLKLKPAHTAAFTFINYV